jgi:diadenylate cyclase
MSFGEDGRLVSMQVNELIGGIKKEEIYIIKDYIATSKKKKNYEKVLEEIAKLQYTDLMNLSNIAKILGYDAFENYEDLAVYPKGYRILNKIPKVPSNIVDNLVNSFKSFQHILDAGIDELDNVEGIGEVRARNIKQSLNRMQEQLVFENIMN